MILLVPVYPEVPKVHRPKLWPGLVLVIILTLTYLEAHHTLVADTNYIESIQSIVLEPGGEKRLRPEAQSYLQLRPLLRIAPAPADWDLKRLLFANFIHGGEVHLILNLVGAFAGARICAAFMPFLVSFSIFIVGGSLGLLASLLLSFEISGYIPHVGASAGIFSLMGAYYACNFKYRTKYFFWFPLKSGQVALRTSWFFFVDVILIELLLSTSQFFPTRYDNVDHIAHVVGFLSGIFLATMLRSFQRWPAFLQTRAEFIYWVHLKRPRNFHPVNSPLDTWLELLQINGYNDQVKIRVLRTVTLVTDKLSDEQISRAFQFISPTFVRLHPEDVAFAVREVVAKNRILPRGWLEKLPYDSVIRIAKLMTQPPEEQKFLYQFIMKYREVHLVEGPLLRKLELLIRKLDSLMAAETVPGPGGQTSDPTETSNVRKKVS